MKKKTLLLLMHWTVLPRNADGSLWSIKSRWINIRFRPCCLLVDTFVVIQENSSTKIIKRMGRSNPEFFSYMTFHVHTLFFYRVPVINSLFVLIFTVNVFVKISCASWMLSEYLWYCGFYQGIRLTMMKLRVKTRRMNNTWVFIDKKITAKREKDLIT